MNRQSIGAPIVRPPRRYATKVIRLSIRYTGVVQGVGFRATARNISRRHKVTGWVRNDPDGAVTLEVQGEACEVAAFREELSGALAQRIRGEHEAPAAVVISESNFVIQR